MGGFQDGSSQLEGVFHGCPDNSRARPCVTQIRAAVVALAVAVCKSQGALDPGHRLYEALTEWPRALQMVVKDLY